MRLGNALMILFAITMKKPVNILLADDDDDDRDIFIEIMKEISPEVIIKIARNGEDVFTVLSEPGYRPDIIFLDLNMPIKGGYECLKEIRATDNLKNIPVVIYSTSTKDEHIEETYLSGANLYIPKPDSYSGLHKMATQVLALNWNDGSIPSRDKYLLNFNRSI
jgi:CheY-like chemotaxis protein